MAKRITEITSWKRKENPNMCVPTLLRICGKFQSGDRYRNISKALNIPWSTIRAVKNYGTAVNLPRASRPRLRVPERTGREVTKRPCNVDRAILGQCCIFPLFFFSSCWCRPFWQQIFWLVIAGKAQASLITLTKALFRDSVSWVRNTRSYSK